MNTPFWLHKLIQRAVKKPINKLKKSRNHTLRALPTLFLTGWLGLTLSTQMGCTPSVQVAMPNEPININLNVKIQHEILIKVDKQLDAMFSESSGLF
jgi:hypothetical protein